LPRKIAVSLTAWKLQMDDVFISQLIVRLRRLGICEVLVVVYQGEPEETLIRFVPPKNAPSNLEMNSEIMGVQRKCVSWSQFEVACRLKLQALNIKDARDRKKYFLQGTVPTLDLLGWK
jgi:hypothetical protein